MLLRAWNWSRLVRTPSCEGRKRKSPTHIPFTLLLALALARPTPVLANQEYAPPDHPESVVDLIVQRVEPGYQGAKAGLRKGDVLRGWRVMGDQTPFRSPFELAVVEIEVGQEKTVNIEGLRGTRAHEWGLEPGKWGIEIQPQLSSAEAAMQGALQESVRKNALGYRVDSAQYQRVDSSWLPYWLLKSSAESLASRKEWKEADAIYNDATRVQQIPPNVSMQLYWSWAATYEKRGDTGRAKFCYQQALTESQKLGAPLLTAFNLNALGNLAYRHGDLDVAEQNYRQALSLGQNAASTSLIVATSLNWLGNIAQVRTDLTRAEDLHLQALGIRERLSPDGIDVASSFNNLGNVEESRGNLRKAEEYHLRALAIRQKLIPGSLNHAASLLNLGAIADDRADLESAQNFYLQALEIARRLEPGGPTVATLFNNLAVIAVERGQLSASARFDRKALEIEEKLAPGGLDVAQSLHNLGDVAERQGKVKEAEQYLRKALVIQNKLAPNSLSVADTFDILATVARDQGNLPRSEEYYRNALTIRERLAPDSQVHARILASLASLLHSENRFKESADMFEQAVNGFENESAHLGGSDEAHFRFRAQHDKYYREYIDLLLQLQEPERALDVLEQSRARTLLEMLSEARIDLGRNVDPALLQREQTIQHKIEQASDRRISLLSDKHTEEQLGQVNREIEELLTKYQQLQAEIRSNSPNYAALTQPQPLSAKQIQQDVLDQDTLLLEYMLGEKRSYLWVVGQGSIKTFQLPSRHEIEDLARHVFTSWTARSQNPHNESPLQRKIRLAREDAKGLSASETLSEMILGPALSSLHKKRLLVVGDGALLYIPFAALPIPARDRVVRMVESYEIVNLPSASVLSLLRAEEHDRPRAPKSVAVLADPVFQQSDSRVQLAMHRIRTALPEPGDFFSESLASDHLLRSMEDIGSAFGGTLRLQRLPYTRLESKFILSATPRDQALEALDFQATRALAASSDLAQYKIVHFATHGIIDSKNPQLSGLVFSLIDSKGHPQNGFLELQDIYNLNLPVDLVVLSACETGLGKEIDGEGLLGLTRGFMYAGASRVVASLWKVSDAGTARLMAQFYQAMEQKGMPATQALRSAQQEMLKENRWSAPYYWAAFQIQGEWK